MAETATVEEQPELRRVMGPGLLLLFVVGDILGTGVYALTGQVAGEVGGAGPALQRKGFVVDSGPHSIDRAQQGLLQFLLVELSERALKRMNAMMTKMALIRPRRTAK